MWYVITHTSLNFNAAIVKQPAKLGFVRVITYHKITDAINYSCHNCSRAILGKMAQVFLKLNFQNRIRNRFFLLKIKVLRYIEDRHKQIMYTYHFKVFLVNYTINKPKYSCHLTFVMVVSSCRCIYETRITHKIDCFLLISVTRLKRSLKRRHLVCFVYLSYHHLRCIYL